MSLAHLPIQYMHKIDTSFVAKKLKIESTHPGLMVSDGRGNLQSYEQSEVVIRRGEPAYLFDIPPLSYLNKDSGDTFTAKFGQASGEHLSHAAIVAIQFGSSRGANLEEKYAPVDDFAQETHLRCELFDFFELDAAVNSSDTNTSGNGEGKIDIGDARFLVLKPRVTNEPFARSSQPFQEVSITIHAVTHTDGNIKTEDEMNCHVVIIAENPVGGDWITRVGLLDPESALKGRGTEGDSITVKFDLTRGGQPPYCMVVPFIRPKTTVSFEIGDPEPNSKIIIDDA